MPRNSNIMIIFFSSRKYKVIKDKIIAKKTLIKFENLILNLFIHRSPIDINKKMELKNNQVIIKRWSDKIWKFVKTSKRLDTLFQLKPHSKNIKQTNY